MSIVLNLTNGVLKKTQKLFQNKYRKVRFNWLKVRMLKNLSEGKLHTINLFEHQISFRSRDEFLHSLDEIFIEEVYNQHLGPNPLIIDCGANIGLSVIYMKMLYPDARVIAFEPDKTNFALLKGNITSFELSNVDIRQEAIWTENTTLSFVSAGSLMSHIEENTTLNDAYKVQAVRLKDLLKQSVDFLKIDIEGAEYKVLKDIEQNLNLVNHLFIEYHGTFKQNHELNEILQIVVNSGFYYYVKEAIDKHPTPFQRTKTLDYDVQLNIFCFRNLEEE